MIGTICTTTTNKKQLSKISKMIKLGLPYASMARKWFVALWSNWANRVRSVWIALANWMIIIEYKYFRPKFWDNKINFDKLEFYFGYLFVLHEVVIGVFFAIFVIGTVRILPKPTKIENKILYWKVLIKTNGFVNKKNGVITRWSGQRRGCGRGWCWCRTRMRLLLVLLLDLTTFGPAIFKPYLLRREK